MPCKAHQAPPHDGASTHTSGRCDSMSGKKAAEEGCRRRRNNRAERGSAFRGLAEIIACRRQPATPKPLVCRRARRESISRSSSGRHVGQNPAAIMGNTMCGTGIFRLNRNPWLQVSTQQIQPCALVRTMRTPMVAERTTAVSDPAFARMRRQHATQLLPSWLLTAWCGPDKPMCCV